MQEVDRGQDACELQTQVQRLQRFKARLCRRLRCWPGSVLARIVLKRSHCALVGRKHSNNYSISLVGIMDMRLM